MNFQIPAGHKEASDFCSEWLAMKDVYEFKTSGSTGSPKTIILTRQQLETSAISTGKALNLKRGDSALLCLNPAYIAGKMMLVRAMVLDLKLTVTNPASDPLEGLPDNYQFDFTAFVPLQLETILNKPDKTNILNKCKAILVGGANVSKELLEKIQDISAPVYSTFGMTETVSHIALQRLNGPEKTDYFTTMEDITIGQDTRGCLTIKGPVTNNEEIVSNDLITLVEPDKFYWRGRIDNVINSGGIKLIPEELENKLSDILYKESSITKFIFSSAKDSILGEKLILILEAQDGDIDNSKIQDIISQLLDKYERPKEIYILNEFPLTPTNKIDRLKIKELYHGQDNII